MITNKAMQMPFYSYKQFMIDTYGEPLYRVPIDLGLGCPNRKPDGGGGCSFCPEHGSRAAYTMEAGTIEEQVRLGIEFARKRYRARKFLAYIQAFTGTFASASEQRDIYMSLLDLFSFDAISIGTRPDCLPLETLDFLESLKRDIDLSIELGVQTIHNRTLERINRGHDWDASQRALLELAARGIRSIVHVIIGLPGEAPDDFRETADVLAKLPVGGIKIHNLHVIKRTRMSAEYEEVPFKVYDEREYAEILIDFIRLLPPDIPIIRINTDTPDDALVAPRWKMDKSRFRQYVIDRMNANGWKQGDMR